jgi:hypothetical protein
MGDPAFGRVPRASRGLGYGGVPGGTSWNQLFEWGTRALPKLSSRVAATKVGLEGESVSEERSLPFDLPPLPGFEYRYLSILSVVTRIDMHFA